MVKTWALPWRNKLIISTSSFSITYSLIVSPAIFRSSLPFWIALPRFLSEVDALLFPPCHLAHRQHKFDQPLDGWPAHFLCLWIERTISPQLVWSAILQITPEQRKLC